VNIKCLHISSFDADIVKGQGYRRPSCELNNPYYEQEQHEDENLDQGKI